MSDTGFPADFSSRYRLFQGASPAPFEEGECAVSLAADSITLKPPGKAPIRVGFAEVARSSAADYAVRLVLRGGERIEVGALGRRYDELVLSWKQAQRNHKLRALLLDEKLTPGEWETGAYMRRSAEGHELDRDECSVRLMRSSMAVVPENESPFVIPYGHVESVAFNADLHGVVLSLGQQGRIALVRFARRTEALQRRLQEDLAALEARRTSLLQAMLPDQGAFALRRLASVLRDGVAVYRRFIDEASAGAWDALWRHAMADDTRQACASELLARSSHVYLAIKELGRLPSAETRPEEEDKGAAHQFLYFFAIGSALVLEVPSMTDSATYVFRAGENVLARATEISQALAAVQFRREPIYLPEASLAEGPGRRYLEAVRVLAPLREMRAAFVGRAVHSSPEAWRQGLEQALSLV